MNSKSDKYELYVLEGIQQGCKQILKTSQVHTVGNSFESDIYLHDEVGTLQQLEILPGLVSVAITLRHGSAILDSKPMELEKKYKLPIGLPVRLGECLFTVQMISSENEETQKVSPVEIAGTTTSAVGVLSISLLAWQADSNPVAVAAETLSIEEAVKNATDSNASVMQVEGSSYMVKGLLASRDEQLKLDQVLKLR